MLGELPTPNAEPLLHDVSSVARLLGVSPRHIWRLLDRGDFPQPIRLGDRLRRWKHADLLTWLAEQTAGRK